MNMTLAILCLLTSCGESSKPARSLQAATDSLHVSSRAFPPGGEIPSKYTCAGADVSPPLEWTAAPPGTESLTLVVDDPDAPGKTWVHWIAFNLPANLRRLPEAVPKEPQLVGGGRQGKNDFGDIGYGGPCPPPGKAHHYHFKLYALDQQLGLDPGANKQDVVEALRGHIVSTGELIGLFHR